MSKKTAKYGHQTGKSSDKWLSPSNPYTGNGRTRRSLLDGIAVVFKKGKKK